MKRAGRQTGFTGMLLGIAFQAQAAGVGFYATSGSGSADFEDDFGNIFSADTEQSAIGFTFDTNLSKNQLFNYRLGVEGGTVKYKDNGTLELDEVAITNDFGFALVRERALRLWIGPQLRISFQDGNDAFGNGWTGVGAGVGPVLGLNWNIDNGPTLFAKAGYLVSAYVIEDDTASWSYDVTQDSVFANVGIAFRFNE